MDEDRRPDPYELLGRIRKTENPTVRGRLKIFFGYAAGVGKTYAMLDAAHSAQAAGIDVVVGYVEPHTRPATLALLDGLPRLPTLDIDHRGILLHELDLDAALTRRPRILLVDELAHTNAPGCRHPKRFHDVQELLDAGIDVYTTVNVQHIESLNDIVASITQVIVKERIPDAVFDKADQVELVDIEPDELLERLSAGKVYVEHQAQRAMSNFFTRENLVALREIALRRTADRVNRQVENSLNTGYAHGYANGESVLVCLSSSPTNAKVIRTAARMARAFNSSLTALFVETPNSTELSDENRVRLRANLKLAEQLGGRIATVYGENVAAQIAEYATASGISKIVIGRSSGGSRKLFRKGGDLVPRLTALAPNLDIYIIPDANAKPYHPKRLHSLPAHIFNGPDVLKCVSILAASTALGFLFDYLHFSEANIITAYILGALIISSVTRSRFYGIISSVFCVLTFNFFFTDPRLTLNAYAPEYPVTFGIMLVACLITSTLTTRVNRQAKAAAVNSHRTEVLLETSRRLQRAATREDILEAAGNQIVKLLGTPIILYPAENGRPGTPRVFPCNNIKPDAAFIGPDEQAVCAWVSKNKKAAGFATDTLPGSRGLYMPVISRSEEILAVVCVVPLPNEGLDPFESSLFQGMLSELAFALEKHTLTIAKEQAAMQAEKERLRANLLRAISHDLRTPLTSISGNASVLLSNGDGLEKDDCQKLLADIYDDSLWLINLVENLLAVTKLENGNLSIKAEPELFEEIIGEALLHLNKKSVEHSITVSLPDDLLMARMDARLMAQVFINIIDNAVKYTAPGSHISVAAKTSGNTALVEIADDGGGITDEDKAQIFDMFYTVNNSHGDSRRSLGLGLALCQSIVNAHGGQITVRDNLPKGTVFSFALPLAATPSPALKGGAPL